MAQHDLSMTLLVDHMNEIDKRRRLMSISLKEVETKLMLATQDSRELQKAANAMTDEENELKGALESLIEEKQRAEEQLMAETTRTRQCEAEEPLLHAHAVEELSRLEEQWRIWSERLEELEELRQAFVGDPVVNALRKAIHELEADLQSKTQAKEAFEKEALTLTMEIARLRQANDTQDSHGVNCSPMNSDDASEVAGEIDLDKQRALQNLKEEIEQDRMNFEQSELAHRRQIAICEAEAEELEMRAKELSSVLEEITRSREHLANSFDWLHKCLEHKLCFNCMQSSDLTFH